MLDQTVLPTTPVSLPPEHPHPGPVALRQGQCTPPTPRPFACFLFCLECPSSYLYLVYSRQAVLKGLLGASVEAQKQGLCLHNRVQQLLGCRVDNPLSLMGKNWALLLLLYRWENRFRDGC